ncbi:MAG: hypothetical protein U0516_00450 [Candidatus Saccharibacteria bacterium]
METSPTTHKVVFSLLAIVLTICGLALSQQQASASTRYPDGSLLKGSGPGVYYVSNGNLHPILDPETLTTCLGGWSRVNWINDSLLNDAIVTMGVSQPAFCRVVYPNNKTFKDPNSSAVYVISGSNSYWVPNPETLIACLGGWAPVQMNMPAYEFRWAMATYSNAGTFTCSRITYANNTLLQGSGPGVYLVRNSTWLAIPSPAVLGCYGGWSAVHHVSDAEILRLTITYPGGGTAGCQYSLPEGTKLLSPNGTVFLLHNGQIFGMSSAETLLRCYGGWNGVRSASQAEINTMFATYPYAGAAGCSAPPSPIITTKEQRAINWAKSQVGSTSWNGLCELMVEQAFGTRGRYGSALANANAKIATGQMHRGDTNVPAGALAFFGAANVNGGYGHVMLSIGNGQFVSNGYTYNGKAYGARITTISSVGAGPYIGWAWADSSWPGR